MSFRSFVSLVAGSAVIVSAACGGDGRAAQSDSAQNRDLSLPEQPGSPVQLVDTVIMETRPASEAKRSPPPRPAPPVRQPERTTPPVQQEPPVTTREPEVIPIRPEPTSGSIPAGAVLAATVAERVCTSVKPGDRIEARLADTIRGSNGVSIPAGAIVVLEVLSTAPITDSTKGQLEFRVPEIRSGGRSYTTVATAESSTPLERVRTTETKDDAAKVAGGAVVGAILVQVLGKDTRSTVVGAAAGAAAGTGVAILTGKHEGCLKPEGTVKITLRRELIIPL